MLIMINDTAHVIGGSGRITGLVDFPDDEAKRLVALGVATTVETLSSGTLEDEQQDPPHPLPIAPENSPLPEAEDEEESCSGGLCMVKDLTEPEPVGAISDFDDTEGKDTPHPADTPLGEGVETPLPKKKGKV